MFLIGTTQDIGLILAFETLAIGAFTVICHATVPTMCSTTTIAFGCAGCGIASIAFVVVHVFFHDVILVQAVWVSVLEILLRWV